MPLTLLTQHPQRLPGPLAGTLTDPLAVAALTRTLRRRGLARVTPGSVHLHRVPATLLRARTSAGDRDPVTWATAAVQLLRDAAPADPWNNPRVWPTWRQILPHIATVTAPGRNLDSADNDMAWLLDRAGRYLAARGEPRAALEHAERAHHLYRDRFGEDDPRTLASASNLANSLWQLGEYELARRMNEDTLARRRRVLGEDHPDSSYSPNRHRSPARSRRLDEDTFARFLRGSVRARL